MSGGFSFCGIDCGDLGLEYAPSMQDMYVFREGTYGVHEEAFDAHHGGFYYGNTVKPKDFTLRCIFQDTEVLEGIIARCTRFFRRGRTGKLIFDKRPWLWYVATVVSIDVSQFTNHFNGFFTITMRAYYPFARHRDLYLGPDASEEMKNNTGLIEDKYMPFVDILNNKRVKKDWGQRPSVNDRVYRETESGTPYLHFSKGVPRKALLYNGGTEYAPVAIEIAGDVGDGLTITNLTTKQSCSFVGMTKTATSDAGKYLVCDSQTGKTLLTNGETSELNFLYHHEGFIDLAPSFPVWRDQTMTMNYKTVYMDWKDAQGNVVNDKFNDEYIGKYLWVHREGTEDGDNETAYAGKYINEPYGYWIPITGVVSGTRITAEPPSTATFAVTGTTSDRQIVDMNVIEISAASEADLTRLKFVYRPTFW